MSRLEQLKKKFLGFMTADQINEVEITNRGFVYKGNLIAAVSGLSDEVEKVIEEVEKIEPVLAQVEQVEKIETVLETTPDKVQEETPKIAEFKKEIVKKQSARKKK